MIRLWLAGLWLAPVLTGAPAFDLVGFAGLASAGQSGTTGGAAGPHVRVATLGDLVHYAQTNRPFRIEIAADIDLSPLANAQAGFPPEYPTGEILVNSNKTLYSRTGVTLRRGSLRIGKGPNGKHNIIIRNLKFRDLWVDDPSGQYDQYGWDYIGIEAGSHHIWIDHCDFEQSYDGAVDIKGGSDFVTVSWCVFRRQKKCSLVGASDNAGATDRGRLNVTFHHNWYDQVEERIPRMRFGNAHVFNIYATDLAGKGIQSTTEAATLVEHCFFRHPRPTSRPTIEANGGPTGTVKVVNSVIENLPGANVQFRQHGASNFTFNPPFAGSAPPYPYSLDPVAQVPWIVTNYAGTGKIGFELWRSEQFSPADLANPDRSGPAATPANDGVNNLIKYALGLPPFEPAPRPLTPLRLEAGDAVLTFRRRADATDVTCRIEVSSDLKRWSSQGVATRRIAATPDGLEVWEARHPITAAPATYFRLSAER